MSAKCARHTAGYLCVGFHFVPHVFISAMYTFNLLFWYIQYQTYQHIYVYQPFQYINHNVHIIYCLQLVERMRELMLVEFNAKIIYGMVSLRNGFATILHGFADERDHVQLLHA